MNIAIFCIGNRLMLDDGAGPVVHDALREGYCFGSDVSLYDAGCMTMDLLPQAMTADYLIVVDAVDGTGEPAGTVFRFAPADIAPHGIMQSLHDLSLSDLINACALLGHDVTGVCFGVQALNMSPSDFVEGLTPAVKAAIPLLVDSVLAELLRLGETFTYADGTPFTPPTAKSAAAEGVPGAFADEGVDSADATEAPMPTAERKTAPDVELTPADEATGEEPTRKSR